MIVAIELVSEPSGSSDVAVLLAAVDSYESKVISEKEARERVWWHSLVFVDSPSVSQGVKRKRSLSIEGETAASKKIAVELDSVDLCDNLSMLKIDNDTSARPILAINTSLCAVQLIFEKLCLGCEDEDCSHCVFSGMADMVHALCVSDDSDDKSQPQPNGAPRVHASDIPLPVDEFDASVCGTPSGSDPETPPTTLAQQVSVSDANTASVPVSVPEGLVLSPTPALISPEASTMPTAANDGEDTPGPSGNLFPIFTNKSFKGPPTPKRRPARENFKQKKRVSKKRNAELSSDSTSVAKQRLLEQYFQRQEWTNENVERLDASL